MCATVENTYCNAELTEESTGFLIPESYEFCTTNNPYFLERPEWLRQATCVHKNIFWMFYLLIFVTTLQDKWFVCQLPLSLSLGAKLYAIFFYHLMEFTSHAPPPNPVVYFASEGPYLVSMSMVAYKLVTADSPVTTMGNKKTR